ncbi:MAG: hypothetical protein ACETWM_09275 [Candidatus Lokiarchaeia archaeon]
MKKRGPLIAIVFLLLTFSILALISISSPPTIYPNFPQKNLIAATKSYTGSGDPLNALLYITNNYNNIPNASDTDNNIYLPCPNGWKIIWANLTFSNITAPNTTIEPNSDPFTNDLEPLFHVMSFRLTSNAYLDYVSVQLRSPSGGNAHFYVYNASNNSGVASPHNLIRNISSVSIPSGVPIWVDVNFGHQFLNISKTYDNTFFIGIEETSSSSKFYWKYVPDATPPGAGYAYEYALGTWSAVDVDFKLKINVSVSTTPNPESAKPTEIGLTVNGSQVSDISKGNGRWISNAATTFSSGYIFYDVDSTWMDTVSFSYIWNVTYAKNSISADANFVVDHNTDALWNITVNATGDNGFPMTDNGINHINITGVPTDWGDAGSKAYNGSHWFELDSYPPSTISFSAGNGTWIVNCTAPNYVAGIGFEVGGVTVENATVDDTLNITIIFDSSVSGDVNLSIYDPSQILNYTAVKTVDSNTSVLFTWNIGDNASATGNYSVTVSFDGGLLVGYDNKTLEIVPLKPTALAVTNYNEYVEYPNSVPIILHYSDSGTGQGLAGAVITAYEGSKQLTIHNLTDYENGTYSFVLDFGTDFGVHDVYFSAKLQQYNLSFSSTISINYKQAMVVVVNPVQAGLISMMYFTMMQQNQTLILYLLIAALLGSVITAAYGTNKWRIRLVIPDKALTSLENIIVDHAPTGATLWVFDFLKMETDVTLLSGFMSAIKSFMGEMYRGGLRKLETEFITFIREDGELLTVTCITSGNTTEEEKWIRQRLRKFISDAEQQHWNELQNWRGDASVFRASFLEILATVIDLDKAEKLQMDKASKINGQKEMLRAELNRLDSQLESLRQRFEAEQIDEAEFKARKAEIEQKYSKVQGDYIDVSLFLSKIPHTLEAKMVTPNSKKTEKMQKKLLKIRMEIEELQRKEQEGKMTSRDTKRKEKLQKELMALIEKPDKLQEK